MIWYSTHGGGGGVIPCPTVAHAMGIQFGDTNDLQLLVN